MKPGKFKAFLKRKHLAELCATGILALVVINLIQSAHLLPAALRSKRMMVYFGIQLILLVVFGYLSYPSFARREGLMRKMFRQYRMMPIPKGAKIVVTIVLIGNFCCIAVGMSRYPFYDVGMFRWSTPFKNQSTVVSKPKYYYLKDGKPQMIDLRKESFFFLSDHWSWGYTHEFTFGITYHNKGQKENFDFIRKHLQPFGIDTLWVGVQSVDYQTGKVTFNPDICRAIELNENQKLHYGPIYIPEYQKRKCHD